MNAVNNDSHGYLHGYRALTLFMVVYFLPVYLLPVKVLG